MAIATRLTALLGIEHPIVSAPMAFVAGGRLAAAVSQAGGLGLIGGGYGDPDWIAREQAAAGNARVGVGFITWSLNAQPDLLDRSLEHSPAAVMLSFGDIRPYAERVKAAGARLICQVQTVTQAREVADQGADIVVAQGTEAGGHGAARSTLPLVPAVVDAVGDRAVVLAAGGVADGRGLAAALALGAEGVLVGTRFYATRESLAPATGKRILSGESGDRTWKGSVLDRVRGKDWPEAYKIRTLRNPFIDEWAGREEAMEAEMEALRQSFDEAAAAEDMSMLPVIAGEAADLVRDVAPAGEIVERMVAEAEAVLARTAALVAPGEAPAV